MEPHTRFETYLARIAGEPNPIYLEPKTRDEYYLDKIAERTDSIAAAAKTQRRINILANPTIEAHDGERWYVYDYHSQNETITIDLDYDESHNISFTIELTTMESNVTLIVPNYILFASDEGVHHIERTQTAPDVDHWSYILESKTHYYIEFNGHYAISTKWSYNK